MRVMVFITTFLLGTTNAAANPMINEIWRAYPVDATNTRALMAQMKQRGPNGFWAFTTWYVRWTSRCQVTVDIEYTMPRHQNRAAMAGPMGIHWDNMVAALQAHERKHGAHGIAAAHELIQNKCRNGDKIIRNWAKQDRILDQRTNHGQTEGVILP